MTSAVRSIIKRVSPKTTGLLICDLQEKFRQNICYFPEIVQVSKRLLDAAKVLDMKVVATEQYPKGLGHTVEELKLAENKVPVVEKTRFSMCKPEVQSVLGNDIKSVILCGIEGHVCVYQTTLDFLEKGIDVHVVVDAVSSRSMIDRTFAFKQLERAGAVLTTSECVILGLVGDSAHPKFREVQKIILTSAPDTGLLKGAN
uniref:Isochorismatase domain-containing protein 1 n=1 Tax=Steinernema glaseri TaxID=37863 RepID=A0A1I7Y862_9BILA